MFSIEEQQRVIATAYSRLKIYLDKYSLSMPPNRADPGGVAFYQDSEAVEAYRAVNRERNRLRRETDKAGIQASRKKYSVVHKTQIAAYDHARVLARTDWYHMNPIEARDVWNRRRRTVNQASGSHLYEEFLELCRAYDNHCFYCLFCGNDASYDKLTEDHLKPLALGGSDDLVNIVPACSYHNSSKGARTMPDYLKQLVDEGYGCIELMDSLVQQVYNTIV